MAQMLPTSLKVLPPNFHVHPMELSSISTRPVAAAPILISTTTRKRKNARKSIATKWHALEKKMKNFSAVVSQDRANDVDVGEW